MSEQNLTSTPSVVVNEDTQQNSVVRFLFDDHGVRGEIVHLHDAPTHHALRACS